MPPVGWSWKFGEYVFLERSFDKDKEIILRQVQELGDYPDPIWVNLTFIYGSLLVLTLIFFNYFVLVVAIP